MIINKEHICRIIVFDITTSYNKRTRIDLYFIDGYTREIYFESIEERDTYINTHFNDNKYLKI